MQSAGDPMAPDDVAWSAVSPRLALGRRLVSGAGNAVISLVLLLVSAVLGRPLVAFAALIPVVLMAWEWWFIGRQVRSIAYAERDDDLLVRKGVLFRSLVVVPYGRMQFVDVEAGPLDRALGIARVQLHTASPSSDASIPGLAPEQASALRDRLAQRGEARLAGL